MNAWRCARNVPLADEHIQANTFFVATIAGDALSQPAAGGGRRPPPLFAGALFRG
jgi:hypothetical protein